ncbi:hypothetical protein V1524DRAFT_411377 [Lipomyces starkeyi]
MAQNIGWRTYIIFAILNTSFVPIVFFYFKETRGLSLEEVDLLFASEEALQRHDLAVQQVTAEKATSHFLELKQLENVV